jgi:hypothetical protein
MTTTEKKRCHTIGTAVAHLQRGYTLWFDDDTCTLVEMEKLINEMLTKDLDKGILSGVISDYKIHIVEPKSPKSLLKIAITKTV